MATKTAAKTGARAPKAPEHSQSLLGTLVLFAEEEGGREYAVWSGWHCQLKLPSGLEDAMVVVEGRETIAPGSGSPVRVFLTDPEQIEPQWLVAETVLDVLEDGQTVGRMQIFEPLGG